MAKIFQKHPLPWSYKAVSSTNSQYKLALVDVSGNEINLSEPGVTEAVLKMTELLGNYQKRQLGWNQRSQKLFVIKDTKEGKYWGGASIMRTQHFRTEHQALRKANRANQYEKSQRYVVVELEVKEKVV